MTLKIKRRLGTPKYNIEHFTGAAFPQVYYHEFMAGFEFDIESWSAHRPQAGFSLTETEKK